MPEGMNLSVNGQSQVPPGFRFHPTEEELLHYYLRKKVASEKIDLDVIRDVDLNKLEPWDIQEKCRIGSTPQNDWYFFSHKDKKYPTGTRTNRATVAGFWKATGRDKIIHSSLRRIGMRKTLVFYRGRAPHGQKLDWIMHEYRLDDNTLDYTNVSNGGGEPGQEEGWVVCRVFKKKNYHKALDGPLMNTSTSSTSDPRNDGVLGQILTYMGRSAASCKPENESNGNLQNGIIVPDTFLHLPELMEGRAIDYKPPVHDLLTEMIPYSGNPVHHEPNNDWVALDRLVASQLNGQYSSVNGDRFSNYSDHNQNIGEDFCFSFDDDETAPQLVNMHQNSDRGNDDEHQVSSADTDFWTFARSSSSLLSSSSSDPLSHLSV